MTKYNGWTNYETFERQLEYLTRLSEIRAIEDAIAAHRVQIAQLVPPSSSTEGRGDCSA